VSLGLGLALLLAGLFLMLAAVHFKGLRYFDRPTLARNAWFDPTLGLLKWVLIAAALSLILRSSRPVFFVVVAALLGLWSYRAYIRSGRFQQKLLRRDFDALKRERPALSDAEILTEIASRRHPAWGPELIEQMVVDYPTLESFARMVALMERGFRGFRGRRPKGRQVTPGAE
jgi:hypothetical protein